MSIQLIKTKADIIEGTKSLIAICPHMRRIHKITGDPPLRRRKGGLEGLARIIIGQQLSIASANAIWSRFSMSVKPLTAKRLLSESNADLRAAGLSAPKIRTLKALATAMIEDNLDFKKIRFLSEDLIHERLTAVHGIGPWTADIYILFCLGHADGWASGDLALQYAVQDVLALKQRPKQNDMDTLAEQWRPWRGVAARMLWAHYRLMKEGRSGVPV